MGSGRSGGVVAGAGGLHLGYPRREEFDQPEQRLGHVYTRGDGGDSDMIDGIVT